MSSETTLYGIVECSGNTGPNFAIHFERNQKVITALPDVDDFPPLLKSMFSVPMPDTNAFYRTQLIHFAASFNHFDVDWAPWLQKFESLIRRLYWDSITLHRNMQGPGETTFRWVAIRTDDPDKPVKHWQLFSTP